MNLTSHSSFDKYVLLQFKSGLRDQQRELQLSIEQAEQKIRALADSRPSIEDGAPDNSVKEEIVGRLSQYRSHLRLVEVALEAIRSGTFGSCGDCGGAIGTRRLQAVPWTSYCIQCQERLEKTGPAEIESLPLLASL
jgi:DnaK suppressor protein